MNRRLLSILSFLVLAIIALAQDINSYYRKANGKTCVELKAALKTIIANHTKLGYGNLWAAYEQVDYIEGDTNADGHYRVFDYYSDKTFYFNGDSSSVSGMNKEHVVPKSWWGGSTSIPVGNDLIQVIPSEAKANIAKQNYPLGVVVGTPSFPNSNSDPNTRVKTGQDANGDMVFEPCDENKGDFARIYFYVATCYPDVAWEERTDAIVSFVQEDYPTFKSQDFVDMLLQWHRQDPVDEWEQTRINRVYEVQKNRNPFVDFPELAEYIWGDKMSEVFTIDVSGGDDEEPSTLIFDFAANEWGLPDSKDNIVVDAADFTKDGYTITVAGSEGNGYYWNNSVKLLLGKEGAYLTLPAFEYDVVSIDVVGTATASEYVKQNIYVGDVAVSTETTGAKNVTNTYAIAEDYQAAGTIYTLRVLSNSNTQISKIVVNFKSVTTEQQEPVFDFAYEAETDYRTPYSLSTEAITGGPATLSVVPAEAATVSGLTITPIYAGKLHATVSTAATNSYYAGSDDFELTVAQPEPIGGALLIEQAETLFEERFSDCNGPGGNDGTWSNIKGYYSYYSGDKWDEGITAAWGASGCLRIGSSSNPGTIASKPISVTGDATLTFKAGGWGTGTNTLTVTATGGTLTGDTEISLTNGEWANYAIDITEATGDLVLTFSGKRGFIDDIVIESMGTGSDMAMESIALDSNGLATFASNYTLDLSDAETRGYSAWKAVEVNDGELILEAVSGIVPAGTALVFKGEANAELNVPTTDDEPTADVSDNLFEHTLAKTVVWADEYLQLDGEQFTAVTDEYAIIEAGQAILSANMLDESYEATALELVFGRPSFAIGDVNCDGSITIADVTALVNIILGKTTEYRTDIADVNGDQAITIADVTALVNVILGK
ncbi:MAG: endonuclease [Bacteroidaceae bacterium]|nr:endonuclease [Bacteroidaceae bacterium]